MAALKGSFDSAIASWRSGQRSKSPTQPQGGTSPHGRHPGTGLSRPRSPSPHHPPPPPDRVPHVTSPERAASPVSPRNSRSFGAGTYSVDYVKKHSLAINTDAKDADTHFVRTVTTECDARCSLVTSAGPVWIGERDGGITIRRPNGDLVHIIERRKGTYVWSLCEVGNTVWAGCSDGFIRVLSQQSYKLEHQFARHAGGGGGVYCLAFHAPSKTVFSGSNDWEILAWEAPTFSFLRQLHGHSGAVRALLTDGNTLYSASDDGSVVAWNIPSAQKVHQWSGHSKGVHSLCVTDQHVWSGSEDATIRIWHPGTGECLGIAEVHTGPVEVLTTVGHKVWSGAGDTVCVWDAVRLKLLGTYVTHDGYLNTIIITHKIAECRVWTAGSDQTIKLWRTEAPDETAGLQRRVTELECVQYDNDQLRDATGKLTEAHRTLSETLAVRDRQVEELANKLAVADTQLARLATAQAENLRLRDDLARADLHQQDAESRLLDASSRIALSDRRDTEYHANQATLASELAATRAEVDTLSERLRTSIEVHANAEAEMRANQATEENARLRVELQACREEMARERMETDQALIHMNMNADGLAETRAAYELKIRDLQETLAAVEARTRQDMMDTTALSDAVVTDVQRALAEAQVLHTNDMLTVTTTFEARIAELETSLADSQAREHSLTAQNRQMTETVEKLTADHQRDTTEIEHLTNKVRDMDVMFKSRLSLITDIYKAYRRLDALEKRSRGTNHHDLGVVAGQYRTLIASHFTDDELAHLGSSRHFFPQSTGGSAASVMSPRSKRRSSSRPRQS